MTVRDLFLGGGTVQGEDKGGGRNKGASRMRQRTKLPPMPSNDASRSPTNVHRARCHVIDGGPKVP